MSIYLDHAASTPLRPEAREAMLPYFSEPGLMANPHSVHSLGRESALALDFARGSVAAQFACEPTDLIFNSGGSEGDTEALFSAARLLWRVRKRPLHIAISAVEHEAVNQTAALLAELGHRISVIPVTAQGVVSLEAIERCIREEHPDILSLMAVNNEIGTLQPVGEAAQLCARAGVLLHTDAVRAIGHGLRVICTAQHIPLLNGTAHKFGGPRGVGLLVARHELISEITGIPNARLPQHICGVGQEGGSRAGTENLAGIVGLATALSLCSDGESAHLEHLRGRLEQQLRSRYENCVIHGLNAPRATHVTSVAFPGADGPGLAALLDERGVQVGAGSACHSEGGSASSHTLRAMQVEPRIAGGTLRISLGWNTEDAHIDALLEALDDALLAQGWKQERVSAG